MWEWLLWTGISLFGLILVAAVFNFYLIVLLVILVTGLAVMVWVRFIRFPPLFEVVRAEAGQAALLHPLEVRPSRVDDPAEGRASRPRPAGAARTPSAAGEPQPAPALSGRDGDEPAAADADRGPPLRGRPPPPGRPARHDRRHRPGHPQRRPRA